MDKEEFIKTIWNVIYYNVNIEYSDESLCWKIATHFYEDFMESFGLHFGEQTLILDNELAERIVKEELAAMEYE